MCNCCGYSHPLQRLIDEFSTVGAIRWDRLEPSAPLDQIRPRHRAPIIRPANGGPELAMLRWAWSRTPGTAR
jgi:hypothetical protein